MIKSASQQMLAIADCIALIRKAPRSVDELAQLTEINDITIRRYISALEGEGLVAPAGPAPRAARTGPPPSLYRWVELHEVTRHRCRVCGCDDPIAAAHQSNGAGVTSAAHSEPA